MNLSSAVALGSFLYDKADLALLGLQRCHQLPDGIENNLDLSVLLILQSFQLAGKSIVRS